MKTSMFTLSMILLSSVRILSAGEDNPQAYNVDKPAPKKLTMTFTADAVMEMDDIKLAKIIHPMIKISDPSWFGATEYIPLIDSLNSPFALFYCKAFGYKAYSSDSTGSVSSIQAVESLEDATTQDLTTPLLVMENSAEPKKARFSVSHSNDKNYRTIICKMK
ncbi:MAG: hypothetical protein JWQ35_174 [Bacteriovoracaceae bacterium]|nr:hypothetical protein [Bacteriovoracaceae bacterium]